MEINKLLVKPLWKRRLPRKYSINRKKNASLVAALEFDSGQYQAFSQTDFLDELHPSSHIINSSEYRSPRKKFKYNKETKENEVIGLEPIEAVAVSLQEGILRHKVTHTFGNEMWFGAEGKDELMSELVSIFKSHWTMAGMKDALNSFGRALFGTGDAALYLYRDNEDIKYRVFSYEEGDVYTTAKDDDGNDIFVRLLMVDEVKTVEIYGHNDITVWQESDSLSMEYLNATNSEKSSDGYILKSRTTHGAGRCPVIYARWDDVVWGKVQSNIEHIEKLLSDLAENNRYYAYQILFLKGGVMNLPGVDVAGKVIASKTTDGDAKILEPADASNTFTLDFEKNMDLIWENTGTVVIEPKELKAGENSGAFIKNLYWREVQWSTNAIAKLRPTFNDIIKVFKTYVGNISERSINFKTLKMSFLLEPFVPQNLTEEITNVCSAVAHGITSKETGSGEVPFNHAQEYQRILKEQQQKMEDSIKILQEKNTLKKNTLDNKALQ